MEIGEHWKTIKTVFEHAIDSSMQYSVATINEDGSPHLTPIGALFLRDDNTGFLFDVFSIQMSNNLERDPRVCILAVNSSLFYWQKSILVGRCETPPSVRLIGTAGKKRKATGEEVARWQNRVEFARGTRGYDLLWSNMQFVRDLYFDSFEPVNMGAMTQDHWQD